MQRCMPGGSSNSSIHTLVVVWQLRTDRLVMKFKEKNKSVFSLVNSAVNMTLPAFAAERRAAATTVANLTHVGF